MHFGGQSATENELIMIIKLEAESIVISSFKYYFHLETSESGSRNTSFFYHTFCLFFYVGN